MTALAMASAPEENPHARMTDAGLRPADRGRRKGTSPAVVQVRLNEVTACGSTCAAPEYQFARLFGPGVPVADDRRTEFA